MSRTYCSIFDLDETLIRHKSMLAVLETYHRVNASSPANGDHKAAAMQNSMTTFLNASNDRCVQNRWFYRQLKGIDIASMRAAAQHWFQQNKSTLYHTAIVAELAKHQHNGATVIVVTGSFREAVEPIICDLGIDHLVCADPTVANGKYTGELNTPPTIAQGKVASLLTYLAARNISLDGSYAYGDHDSDIPMLTLVDRPVAVGCNPTLIKHATCRGWRVIHHS